ncbi:MAG: pectinesterase family protein, partial [Lachnospirales bacterium]
MNKKFKRVLSLLLSVAMTFSCMTVMYSQQALADDLPTIYLVGDSTGCHYSESTDNGYYYKRVGFGDKLADYFDTSKVNISNLAMSGRSSLSFTTEKNYTTLTSNIKSGDILLIAFGHNDEKTTEGLYTNPTGGLDDDTSFKYSLYNNYIKVAQDAGATPILCSPIVRLPSGTSFKDTDLHKANGGDYRLCAEELAENCGIGFIDLTTLTETQYNTVGLDYAAKYHAQNNLLSVDKTHINNYGAKMIANLIYQNAPTELAAYKLENAAEPSEETDLFVDPSYVDPSTSEGDTDDITGDALNSSIWTTTSPWYGSAFGVIGATPSTKDSFKQYFDITENGENVNVKAVGGKGKLSATVDGLSFYYQPISALENFQIIADVTINSVDNTNSQVSFGAMMTDKIAVDTRFTTTEGFDMGNYVVAGPYKMAGSKPYAGFIKSNSSLDYEEYLDRTTELPKAGDTVHVSIAKAGTYYTVTYGEHVSKFQLSDTQMKGVIYAGFFASRNADVTFKNIVYNNEVVEDIVEPEPEPELDPTIANDFEFWADENLTDGNFVAKSYGAEGSIIKVTNSKVNLTSYSDGTMEGHTSYKIGKYNAGNFGSVTFTPASDGWATLYFYTGDKSYYVSTTAIDKTGADYTITATPYTIPVEYEKSYNIFTDGTSNFALVGITYQKKVPATVSGTVNVSSEAGNTIAEGSTLTFTNNTTGDVYTADIASDGTYSVELSKDFDYTYEFTGTDTLVISGENTVSITEDTTELNITLTDADAENITGTIYGPAGADTTIKFGDNAPISVTIGSNGTGTYQTSLKPGTYTVEVGTIDGYTASDLSTADLVVKHAGNENYKNVLYTKPVDAATGYDVYVDQSGTYYTDNDNVYTNLADAMAAIDASGLKGSSSQRFIVHVAPGLYEEQFFVNSNYISIIADSNGDSIVDGDVTLSWYYGIDYKYYSIDPATGFYSQQYAVDKHNKTTCTQKWGATMIIKGSNFYTEGIKYQNTFNLELREAELVDGVENDATNSDANTSYDRTQANADVKLTTATERAAALAIDGQQAEFYNCQFLGSQDTIYTGNYNHYFNNCLIAGETDYIFGNGGTSIFDNCKLQWIDYHYPTTSAATKGKPGYIAVPRGSYIFRNCEITSSGEGLDVSTGSSVTTKGYYGRPWGTTAAVIFMNCQTNDLILDAGWNSMSGVDPSEVAFREYNNTKSDGSLFYSELTSVNNTPDGSERILSDEEANSLADVYDWNIFGTWLPQSHVAYEGNPNIYKFDFTPGADSLVSPLSNEDGTAQLTFSGLKYHGTTYGASAGNGAFMTIYAGSDASSMEISVNSSYNGNSGTLELYKNDEETPIDSIEFENEVDNEAKIFNVTYVVSGDSFTIKYIGTSSFYCGNVTATSADGTLTKAPVTNDYNFDFVKATTSGGHTQGEAVTDTILDDNGVAEVSLTGFKHHASAYGFTTGASATATFTVETAGKATITIDSSYQENNEIVTLKNSEGTEIGNVTLTGITSGIIKVDNLEAGEYTLEYAITDGATRSDGSALTAFYTKGINISMSEEGTLAAPKVVVPTTTYTFDFKALCDGTTDAISGDVNDTTNTVPMTVGGTVNRHTGGHGVAAKNGSTFSFTVTE